MSCRADSGTVLPCYAGLPYCRWSSAHGLAAGFCVIKEANGIWGCGRWERTGTGTDRGTSVRVRSGG